ncbi:MAG: hypothetical protein MI867_30495, partial [Pseudomonadales bacterium]|nr:hypothetical protein [Pseudomonadales bacterium]
LLDAYNPAFKIIVTINAFVFPPLLSSGSYRYVIKFQYVCQFCREEFREFPICLNEVLTMLPV